MSTCLVTLFVMETLNVIRRFLFSLLTVAAFGQSFHYPAQPPRDLPPAAQKVAKAWFDALRADDWKTVARLGAPYTSVAHSPKDGGTDIRFFKGFTHYAAFMVDPESGKKALNHILSAYREVPDQGEICYQAGRLLLESGRPAEAIRPLEDAVRLYPFPGARVDLAVALNGAGRSNEALPKLQQLDREFPDNRRIRYDMAWALTSLHRAGEAVPILQGLVLKDPKDAGAHQELGFILIDLGKPAEAISHLKASANLQPTDYRPWSEMVTAYLALNQVAEARSAAEKARKLGAPDSVVKALRQEIQDRKPK